MDGGHRLRSDNSFFKGFHYVAQSIQLYLTQAQQNRGYTGIDKSNSPVVTQSNFAKIRNCSECKILNTFFH